VSERMVRQFMEMVRIDSESGNEARFMEYLLKEIVALGGAPALDGYGNLIASFRPKGSKRRSRSCSRATAIRSSRASASSPCWGDDGIIRSKGGHHPRRRRQGRQSLKCSRRLRVASVRPPVEFAVSRQEEVGLLGVRAMDFSRITARRGFLNGQRHPRHDRHRRSTYVALDVKVTGRASTRGWTPRRGINAIRAAAKAISALPLGRIDHETTANVGVINGGLIRNGVPAECTFLAECRSGTTPRRPPSPSR